jgi:hypothetical protein
VDFVFTEIFEREKNRRSEQLTGLTANSRNILKETINTRIVYSALYAIRGALTPRINDTGVVTPKTIGWARTPPAIQ